MSSIFLSLKVASTRLSHLTSANRNPDNLVNQRVLAKQLRKLGAIVDVANHGVEALSHLELTKHWTAPKTSERELNVILMDWEMPVMDGVTCARRIRELQGDGSIRAHIPIIGTTANARATQIDEALAAGMVSGRLLIDEMFVFWKYRD